MNWSYLRRWPWLDTRARFVAGLPDGGNLLDLGSSDRETLRHMAELRPDLRLFAADEAGMPDAYPDGCEFQRVNLEDQPLRWPDAVMDGITCMHLLEHLRDDQLVLREIARLLKPGARVYFETPHPRSLTLSSPRGRAAGSFTLNFWDDPTHVRLIAIGALAQRLRAAGFEVLASGRSRNWALAAAYPVLFFFPAGHKKFAARVHWLGWSAYLISRRLP